MSDVITVPVGALQRVISDGKEYDAFLISGPVLAEAEHHGEKPTNPKDEIGSTKLPLHLFPLTAIAGGCLAFLEGMVKYGRSNFRVIGVRASIYYAAAFRHLFSSFEGEDIDPESGLDHLYKALACIAILIDAKACGKLRDDRMVAGGYHDLVKQLTPHVKRIIEQHKGKNPRHYDINDNDVWPDVPDGVHDIQGFVPGRED